jgi:hypothetical protein
MKKNNTWNIRRLGDESFVPATQETSIFYIEDWRIFSLVNFVNKQQERKKHQSNKKMCIDAMHLFADGADKKIWFILHQ